MSGGAGPAAGRAAGEARVTAATAEGPADGPAPPRLRPGRGPRPLPPPSWLGSEYPPYRPTLAFAGQYVDAAHEALAGLPSEGALLRGPVPGFLRPADALLLYELAALLPGDVLELGAYLGLSTTILGQAMRNAGRRGELLSVEREPAHLAATAAAVAAAGLQAWVRPLAGDAAQAGAALAAAGRRFGLVFVDHDHGYPAMRAFTGLLPALLAPGGFAVLHDFNDPLNRGEPAAYGVYRAVAELLAAPGHDLAYLGVQGCSGLLRRAGP